MASFEDPDAERWVGVERTVKFQAMARFHFKVYDFSDWRQPPVLFTDISGPSVVFTDDPVRVNDIRKLDDTLLFCRKPPG